MSVALLQVDNLRTWLAGSEGVVRAVEGVSFSVGRGETFALLGESGCGKTMTALSISRLLPDAGRVISGSVRLEGQDLLQLPEAEMRDVRGSKIGMVFQEPGTSLNPVMKVGAQVGEVLLRHSNLRGSAIDARVLELLDAVGLPDPKARAHEYPFQFSGGMKQRVMIAIALACEPRLLIADEPTTALDVTIQAQVLDLLRDLQKKMGMSILLITHDLGVVSEMAHHVAVMYAGQIVESGRRDDFFRNPAHPYSRKLFASLPDRQARDRTLAVIRGRVPSLVGEVRGCRFADRCDFASPLCRTTSPVWATVESGHGVLCHLYSEGAREHEAAMDGSDPALGAACGPVHPDTDAPLLAVHDLKVYFPIRKGILKRVVGHVKAVDGISLSVRAGRTLALVGESGSGKTTVGKGIVQLLPLSGGSVSFGGVDLSLLSRSELRGQRRDFQIIFQDPYSSLNPRMRVLDIVEEGMIALGVGGDRQARSERVEEILAQVGLGVEMKYRYPHEFSGGQRQRIAIARALAVEPKLIVCDEPTSALDVSVQAQILNLLRDLQSRLCIAYLFITHNMSAVEFLADEVAVMYLGKIVEQGSADEVLSRPQHAYTKALLSAVPRVTVPDGRWTGIRREVAPLTGRPVIKQ